MQTDMHYYGTWAMARAAGLSHATATTIATAAQFVDDNAGDVNLEFEDGGRVETVATAHHTTDVKNVATGDQRRVWVPFHFMPGNEGEDFTERLVCRKNSAIVREAVDHALSLHQRVYAAELMGVVAHVYADTFSHYGFSGVSSRRNRVDNDSFEFHAVDSEIEVYIRGKANKFFEDYGEESMWGNIKSWFGEQLSGALGHAAVATYPDRPYLDWSFTYEWPEAISARHDNPTTFHEGCAALHAMFRRFAELRPDLTAGEGRDFAVISERVADILRLQLNMDGRIDAWKRAAEDGAFGPDESIPHYSEDDWHGDRKQAAASKNSLVVRDLPVYRFWQAAANHRTYVLKDLLPHHGLIVD
ncbi:MAG: hypothetical protein KC457_23940 [Myxococcales bacterium]|nr:hypothetical protein [Myxococcales bacterium]